ncbi:HAD family hydrolase [Psychromonas algicola]|uniref:HAD family hydrolase n=1 Tax=Psychromonas algicola TaxID=2555642 RepID=UPI001067A7F1|nr:hypothetical protein [Psychromonas sp. RZ5]TEW52314.1 hypothetical protein E2R67_03085 [Psychromonas sp. RZ5]
MKVLYFIEPRKELGNTLFRLGTIRNHISKEMLALKKNSNCEVHLLSSQEVVKAANEEKLLEDVKIHSIIQKNISDLFPESNVIASKWYTGEYSDKDKKAMEELCKKSLGTFIPDVIICYESNAPYLKSLFPNAAFLNSMLGALSRAPFPELGCFDPCGIYKDSYIRKFKNELINLKVTEKQLERLTALRSTYADFIDRYNPIKSDDIRGNYKKVILVPLQVSKYFAFDDNLPENSDIKCQLDLVRYILKRVDPSIGIYVTFHAADKNFIIQTEFEKLQLEYSNLLYNSKIQKIRWCSQWILPYVDAVATVSSSVGLQAVFWRKPLFSIGNSHLATFNAGELEEAAVVLDSNLDAKVNFDGALYHLLTRYYPLMNSKVQNGDWLYAFLDEAIKKHRNGSIEFDYFKEPENEQLIFDQLTAGIQTKQVMDDLNRFASHMSSTQSVNMFSNQPVNVFDVKREIEKHDVISFDIFDTLITRRLMHPNHVFDLMDTEATAIFSSENKSLIQYGGFRRLRERAANNVIKKIRSDNKEEISFLDVYNKIRLLTNLSKKSIVKLRKLEIRIENEVMMVRKLGEELYNHAIALGKKVILVSDMYLPASDIEFIVRKLGYSNYDKCYVSSEYNLLKKSGTLFEFVKSEQVGGSILHIGDNYLSDFLKAKEAGISAIHIPLIQDTYVSSRLYSDIYHPSEISDSLGSSLMHGAISRKFYDNKQTKTDWFEGKPYRLGFEACGPVLLGFTKWILEQAIRDGVEDLYFLARDGYLVKTIYDEISSNIPNAPKSHYLLASRRCYSSASLETEQDILDSTSLAFSKVALHQIMEARFDIQKSEIDIKKVKDAGFDNIEQVVDIKRSSQLKKFKLFLLLNKDLILTKAKEERDCLLQYLDSTGINSKRKSSIVDIGHNASLQNYLGKLLGGRTDIGGYYFMTFYGAKSVYDKGFDIKGYLANFEENKFSQHPYCKNIGMFEFLFLPAIPSFKKFIRKEGELKEVYVSGDENRRFKVVEEVHEGVKDYVSIIKKSVGGNVLIYEVSPTRSLKSYIKFIQSPLLKDAKMFDDISFVDQFGGNNSRYLIPSVLYSKITNANYSDFLKDSWWKEGAKVLVNSNFVSNVESNSNSEILPFKEQTLSIYKRKIRKFKTNPRAFLRDSKFLKPICKFFNI